MRNWKHSLSAFLAVVMVVSLATIQANDTSKVSASKEDEFISLDILEGDGQGETIDFDSDVAEKVKDSFGEIVPVSNFDMKPPYEPKTGYVITTTGVLNVREERDAESEIISTLEPGTELWLEGEYENWYLITVSVDGEELGGYVSKDLVTDSYEEAKKILLEDLMYEKAVISAGAEMKSAPDMDASPLQGFESDENVIIVSRVDDNWSLVYTTDDYTAGYVLNVGLKGEGLILQKEVLAERKEKIQAISTKGVIYSPGSSVNVRTMPGEDKEIKTTFSSGTSVLLIKTIGDWVKISYGDGFTAGYVKKEYTMTKAAYDEMLAKAAREAAERAAREEAQRTTTSSSNSTSTTKSTKNKTTTANTIPYAAPSTKGQQIVNEASKYIGVRYVWGGTSPSGFDCSGLVQYSCKKVGISVNRTSRDQYKNGVAVSKSDLQPGDLVFFAKGSSISHVAIYAGNGEVIHAPRPGKRVCRVPLSYITSYSRYVGARRLY